MAQRVTANDYANNQQDALYRLIYYSKSALRVSGDVFTHHQEHLTVFTVSVVYTQVAAGWQQHCYHQAPTVNQRLLLQLL
jgi:hypothetical protein